MMKTNNIQSVHFDAIDIFRVFGALFVVVIHCKPLLPYSNFANTITAEGFCRVAVPFFFLVSGFFFTMKLNNEHTSKFKTAKKYWLNILKIYLAWSVVYLVLPTLMFSEPVLSLKELIWKVLFTSSHYHLWYLLSILYAIPVLFGMLLCNLRIRIVFSVVCGLFYVVHCLRYSYNWLNLLQPHILDMLSRFDSTSNALFCALPFLCIGAFCYSAYNTQKNEYWFYRLLISICLCIFEEMLIYFFAPHNNHFEFLLTTPLVAYYLVNWLSTINFCFSNHRTSRMLRDISLWVYCVHPLFLYLPYRNELIEFFTVTVLSVDSALMYLLAKNIFRRKRKCL